MLIKLSIRRRMRATGFIRTPRPQNGLYEVLIRTVPCQRDGMDHGSRLVSSRSIPKKLSKNPSRPVWSFFQAMGKLPIPSRHFSGDGKISYPIPMVRGGCTSHPVPCRAVPSFPGLYFPSRPVPSRRFLKNQGRYSAYNILRHRKRTLPSLLLFRKLL